jgi:hypothetical protein
MKCPTHIHFFNDTKYLVSGAFETYEVMRVDDRNQRVCKDCAKKLHEIRETKHGIRY